MRRALTMFLGALGIVLCLASVASAQDTARVLADSHEPNDSIASATDIGLPIRWRPSIHENDLDVYRFELTTRTTVTTTIRFTHADGDLDLQLHEGDGTRIAGSWSTTDDERIERALDPGEYLIAVYGYSGAQGTYDLVVESDSPISGGQGQTLSADGLEPNDDLGSATDLALPADRTGLTIHDGADVDLYALSIPGRGDVSARIPFDEAQGDLTIELLDGSGAVLSGPQPARTGRAIRTTSVDAGTHYLRVRGVSGDTNEYDLVASFTPHVANDVTVTTPSSPASGDVAIHYVLTGPDGSHSIVAEYSTDGGRTYERARDAGGTRTDHLQASPGGTAHVFTWDSRDDLGTGTTDVRLRIRVDGWTESATTGTFTVDNPAFSASTPDDLEPNDSYGGASGILRPFQEDELSIHDGSDVDYYTFTAPAGTRVQASISFAHADGDLDLQLRDGSGTFVDGSFSISDDEAIDATTSTAGAHFVIVYGYSGATNAYDIEVTTGGSGGTTNEGPEVSVTALSGEQELEAHHPLEVDHVLSDEESDPVTVEVEYSTDGGSTWSPATPDDHLGDGTTDLQSSPGGIAHVFAWDVHEDIGWVDLDDVRVRITPHDGSREGSPDDTGSFHLDSNVPPSVTLTSQRERTDGTVRLEYFIHDREGDDCSIRVAYHDGTDWRPATLTGGDGTSGLTASVQGVNHEIVWDVPADLAGVDGRIDARLVAADRDESEVETFGVTVDQNGGPVVQVDTPPDGSGGIVDIPYTLSDPEGDPVDLLVECSVDGGTFQNAGEAAGGQGTDGLTADPSGTAHVFSWDSELHRIDVASVVVRIKPQDPDQWGTSDSTASFVVDNVGTPPRPVGPVALEDRNANGEADAGDVLRLRFNQDVVLDDPTAADLRLPVDGDSLGGSPTIEFRGSSRRHLAITLGTGAHLTSGGLFDPASTGSGAASGLEIVPGSGAIESPATGEDAETVEPLDVAPAFVSTGQWLGSSRRTGLVAADLDDDGDLDVAQASTDGARIFINDGLASLSDPGVLVGDDATALAAGDVDGDGDVDLVLGRHDRPTLVFLQDGAGSFVDSGQAIGTGTPHPEELRLGDLDGDGDLDLVSGHDGTDRVFRNDGSGTFVDTGQALGSTTTVDLVLADLDGDGDLDLVQGNDGQADRVWTNDGSGTLSDSGQRLGSGSTLLLHVGDVTGDGHPDIVATRASDPDRIWENDGTGSFVDGGRPPALDDETVVALADVDGDGSLDLIGATDPTHGSGRRVVRLQGAGGSFLSPIVEWGVGQDADRTLAVDLDGDGDLDLVHPVSSSTFGVATGSVTR